jgi:hypothetical protein
MRKCVRHILCQKRLRLSWQVDECKPLPVMPWCALPSSGSARRDSGKWAVRASLGFHTRVTSHQGLTLVHFSAQLKHCLWNRGALFKECLGCFRGY